MRNPTPLLPVILLAATFAAAQNQSTAAPSPSTWPAASAPQSTSAAPVKKPGAGHDIGSGSADIGKGAGGAAGNLAKGTGKGAADLVTLHPVKAGGAVGKGAGHAGKDAAVGAGKGTGKILKGTGKAIKHIF